MKVYTREIQGHKALVYNYEANAHMAFQFHMLCEVGEPFQAEARRLRDKLAARRKCKVVQVELDAGPWFVDALVPASATQTGA